MTRVDFHLTCAIGPHFRANSQRERSTSSDLFQASARSNNHINSNAWQLSQEASAIDAASMRRAKGVKSRPYKPHNSPCNRQVAGVEDRPRCRAGYNGFITHQGSAPSSQHSTAQQGGRRGHARHGQNARQHLGEEALWTERKNEK